QSKGNNEYDFPGPYEELKKRFLDVPEKDHVTIDGKVEGNPGNDQAANPGNHAGRGCRYEYIKGAVYCFPYVRKDCNISCHQSPPDQMVYFCLPKSRGSILIPPCLFISLSPSALNAMVHVWLFCCSSTLSN